MRYYSILAKTLLATAIALAGASTTWAQGFKVQTKNGKTKTYPAEEISHISPYIYSLTTTTSEGKNTTMTYGIDVFKNDGSNDRYLESELKSFSPYETPADEQGTPLTAEIPQSGGKATIGTLTLDMPAGTFNSDTKLTLTEVKKGAIDGDAELSQYYKVKLTSGVRKPFKVSVKMPKLPDDQLVRMQFAMKGWAYGLGEEFMLRHYMDVTYEDGAYVSEIPEMESPDDVGEIEVWYGITTCDPGPETTASRTRAVGDDYLVGRDDYGLYKYLLAFSSKEFEDLYYDLKHSWIPSAMGQVEQLGFKKAEGSRIEYYLINLGKGGIGGFYTRSPWGKKFSEIYLNYTQLADLYKNGNVDEIKATVLHETFHYYQWFYDPRKAAMGHSEATVLEEASSVWSEHLHVGTPQVAKDNVYLFLPSLNPVYKDILAPSNSIGLSFSDRFQNMGYGIATLLEYLTRKCGNRILLDMWEDRKTGDPYDFRDLIELYARKNGIEIYTKDTYHDFIEMLGSGKIYKDIVFDDLVFLREEYDSIGVTTRMIKDVKPVYFTNYLYDYGALLEKLEVSGKYDNDNYHGLDNATGIIEQTTDGVTTWIYRFDKDHYVPCGMIRKGTPLKISPEWFYKRKIDEKDAYTGSAYRISFVTIPDDFKTTAKPISRIAARVLTLNVPEKKMMLPSDEGRKEMTISSNYDELSIKTTADWVNCIWSQTTGLLTIYYDELPTNQAQRKATIQFTIPRDDGTPFVLEEVELTQAKAYINLSASEVEVPVEGGTRTFDITSTNCTNIEVSTSSQFLHPTISGNTITVKIDENPSMDSRMGTVDVRGVMPEYNLNVNTHITFNQAGLVTPEPIDLYDHGYVICNGLKVDIPGKTRKYGDYLQYRSADTQVTKIGTDRQEFSWDVTIYIDPKDNKSMRRYEFYSGSVTWLLNRYYTENDSEGREIEHRRTTRCSYNLKNLYTTDGQDFFSLGAEGSKMSDFVSDYSYEETLDGKTVNSVTQSDIANNDAASNSAEVRLYLAEGVPYLEVSRDTLEFDGGETFELLYYEDNDAVNDVQITTSADWLTLKNVSEARHFHVYASTNKSKADREGYVYVTGTLADGSKLTRTIVVRQKYDPVWEDEWDISEDQKAELPAQAVLNALQSAGMPLYLGSTPPRLNGTYRLEPLKTVYDPDGDMSTDDFMRALVFNLTSNSSSPDKAKMSYYSELTNGKASSAADYYCYFSGEGDSFTLSNITTQSYEGLFSWTTVTVVSGTVEGNQIRNLHYGFVELNDDGGIDYISIGTDGDGLSTMTDWAPGSDEDLFARRRTARARRQTK